MRCSFCGRENPDSELFCEGCGKRLPPPSAEAYETMYRAQEASWRSRRRRDAALALSWGLIIGLGTLAFAPLLESGDDASYRMLVALGKQAWWLIGLLWGGVVWGLRRGFSSER